MLEDAYSKDQQAKTQAQQDLATGKDRAQSQAGAVTATPSTSTTEISAGGSTAVR